jgi:hypothetical protein
MDGIYLERFEQGYSGYKGADKITVSKLGVRRSGMRRLSALVALVILPMGFAADDSTPSVKETINRGLDFLTKDNLAWRKTKQCTECHHAPFTIWALNEGKKQGYPVDEKEVADLTAWAVAKDIPAKAMVNAVLPSHRPIHLRLSQQHVAQDRDVATGEPGADPVATPGLAGGTSCNYRSVASPRSGGAIF